jgi:hypothetical protein
MLTSVKAKLAVAVAATAIATAGAATATGVADAATTHPSGRVPTALSITASTPVGVRHLTFAKISGQLTSGNAPLRLKAVWVERQRPNGHWFPVRAKLTRLHGWVRFRVVERRTTNFRLLYRGGLNFKPAVSAPITITAAS